MAVGEMAHGDANVVDDLSPGRVAVERRERRRDRVAGALLLGSLLVVYNLNGREIGSFDSQSTKFAARELLLRGTLSLDHIVGATPEYADRWGYIHAADGRYRSVYSPVPAIAAAGVAGPFWKPRLIDIRAPLAPGLIATSAASLFVAMAVLFAFMTAGQRRPRHRAIWLAPGLGLGNGFWSTASQTLWQTETAVLGLSIAVFVFASDRVYLGIARASLIGAGLGLAATARPQLAPAIVLLLAGTCWRSNVKDATVSSAIVATCLLALCWTNLRWFNDPFGALPLLRDVNEQIHRTTGSFGLNFEGFAGLLLSPSRGLVVFSPVVLIAAAGVGKSWAAGWRSPLRWCVLALAAQYALYSSYAVWWGGHTYGARYLLDTLPLAVPLASVALHATMRRLPKMLAVAALAWSILVAATGAFCYPQDQWNIDPLDVDRHHERLWSISDTQIARCWQRGLSPQNFRLFGSASVRRGGA